MVVAAVRSEPLCVEVPRSLAKSPYRSACWLPDGSLIAGTTQLVEFADGELRTTPAGRVEAVDALLALNPSQVLAAGTGGAVRFDRTDGLWRTDPIAVPVKPASEIYDAQFSDDGAAVVFATSTGLQYIEGGTVSEWAVPCSDRIELSRIGGRLAVCHYPYGVLGVTPQGPVERPDLAWAAAAYRLMPAGDRIVALFQGRLAVHRPDGALLWSPVEAEKMIGEWIIDSGGNDHELWIATHKGGIRWYNPATGEKIAEISVGRELNDRIYAVTQHPDGRLAVETESRIYVVYPTSVSSLALPSGRLLFFQNCGEGAVAATSGGRVSIGARAPSLDDNALALADWNGRVVVGGQSYLSVDGQYRQIGGLDVKDLVPAGDQLLVLQSSRALLLNRDLSVAAEVTMPAVPNGAAAVGGGFLIGSYSGNLMQWRPSESFTLIPLNNPVPHPIRVKSSGGRVWKLTDHDAFRDNRLVSLPDGVLPVDVSGTPSETWLVCSDAAGGASLWSVPDGGVPILMDAPGVEALRQPQALLVLPSGQVAIVDGSRVLLIDRKVIRPRAASLPDPDAALALDPSGGHVLSLAQRTLRLSNSEDSLILRWGGGDPLAVRKIRWRILPDGDWQQGGAFDLEAQRLPLGSGAIAVNLQSQGQVKTDIISYVREYPWYLRSWTVLLYVALLIGSGIFAVRLRTRRLTRRARQLEQLVAERTAALTRANAAKEEFLASMSHEIRNPLNGVLGICSMLDEAPLAPREQLLARTLRGCSEQLRSLLDDILDFSRIERGEILLSQEDFALQPAIEAAVRTVDVACEKTEINQPSEPIWLSGDPLKLRQIVINLVTNALKYGVPPRAVITCGIDREKRFH